MSSPINKQNPLALRQALLCHFEDKGGFEIEDFIHAYGDSRQALLMFRVFHPEFAEVEGHFVLKSYLDVEGEPQRLTQLLRDHPDNPQQALQGYRWLEVPYIFKNCTSLEDQEDELLASLMSETWLAALMKERPQTRWRTRVMNAEETGSVVGVCFEEVDDPSQP